MVEDECSFIFEPGARQRISIAKMAIKIKEAIRAIFLYFCFGLLCMSYLFSVDACKFFEGASESLTWYKSLIRES